MSGGATLASALEDRSILTRPAAAATSRLHYGPMPDQHVDVWQGPPSGRPLRSLLCLLHGGFWRPAYDARHMAPMAATLAARGCSVANIEYRRVPGEPHWSLDDIRGALECVQRELQDGGSTIVAGFSAGGHLSLCLAATPPPNLRAIVALAPVADLRRARELQLGNDAVSEFLGPQLARLADWDPAQLPDAAVPVTILQGEADGIVPAELATLYLQRHPATRLVTLAATGHFALIDPLAAAWSVVLEVLEQSASG